MRAALADRAEFDSSFVRGRLATFRMSAMINGLGEALAMMTPGARWEVFAPR